MICKHLVSLHLAVTSPHPDSQVFGRSGPITVLTSPFAAVSAAATAEAAAAAAAAEAAEDKGMEMIACGVPTGQESSSDVSHQTNGLALGCAPSCDTATHRRRMLCGRHSLHRNAVSGGAEPHDI